MLVEFPFVVAGDRSLPSVDNQEVGRKGVSLVTLEPAETDSGLVRHAEELWSETDEFAGNRMNSAVVVFRESTVNLLDDVASDIGSGGGGNRPDFGKSIGPEPFKGRATVGEMPRARATMKHAVLGEILTEHDDMVVGTPVLFAVFTTGEETKAPAAFTHAFTEEL